MDRIIPTVGIIVLKKEQVLLIVKDNHPKHLYQLPGGQIEDGETAPEAAARELAETTTLTSTPKDLQLIPQQWEAKIKKDYGEAVFIFTCFLCREYSGDIMKTSTAAPEWIDIKRVDSLPLNPNTLDAINAALQLREASSQS